MATGITNAQIDAAIPNKGSGTADPANEQPSRKLLNAAIKAINSEVNSLGTAATKNVGTDTGNVMEVGAFGLGKIRRDVNNRYNHELGSGFYTRTNPEVTIIGASPGNSMFIQLKYYDDGREDDNILLIGSSSSNASTPCFNAKPLGGDWGSPVEFIHQNNLRQNTGSSTTYPMSQNACTTSFQGISDRRDKTDIAPIASGLAVINALNAVQYRLNKREKYREEEARTIDAEGNETLDAAVMKKPLSEYDENDGSLAREDVYTGFIAQDMQADLEAAGFGDLGLVKNFKDEYDDGFDDRYFIEHTGLFAFIVKAIQELHARLEALEK